MKRYILIFTVALSGMAFSSCSDFLDKEPLGQSSDVTVLADEKNIDQFVSRIYGTLSWREWYIGGQMFNLWEFGADDIMGKSTSGNYRNFNQFTYNSADGQINNYWTRTYEAINHCNQVIDRTPAFENREVADLAEAQAKYFRAYYNFGLVRIFGEAPLRDKLPASPADYDIPKSSSEDFYKLIISDLEYAIAHLKTRSEWGADGLGRITKGTAQGLLAKVYLQNQDYENAYKYANDVIAGGEYRLIDDYRSVFDPANLYSDENMMPGHYMFSEQIWVGRWWNPYAQFQGIGNGVGNAEVVVNESLANAYEEGDPRKAASLFDVRTDVIPGDTEMTPADENIFIKAGNFYANKKVIWPRSYWNSDQFSWTNVNPMFLRFADILLIYAEASNELGNVSEAEKALEKIRFRARGNKSFAEANVLPEIKGLGKEAMREAIWKERRIELAMEFQRWPDLMRYEKVVSGYTTHLLKNVYGRTSFDYAKHSKFPIPQSKLDSSQGILVQNDAWK